MHGDVIFAFCIPVYCFKKYFVVVFCNVMPLPVHVQVKKNGAMVTEMMYHLNIAEKDAKQKQNEAFLRIVMDKTQELKQQHEALILKTMDEISKHERVMQVKVICFFPVFYFIDCVLSYLCL